MGNFPMQVGKNPGSAVGVCILIANPHSLLAWHDGCVARDTPMVSGSTVGAPRARADRYGRHLAGCGVGAASAAWWLPCILAAFTGCYGTRTARIYEVGSGRSGTLVIDREWTTGGHLTGFLPNGESCAGSFSDVAGAKTGILTCGRDRVIQCSMAARDTTDVGFGTCHDASGAEYDVFF